ncbi:DUF3011 domain-containing protein [Polymorphobacter fuscus]|uniref:DUF3011 domain-containing protein n=1 Tax=Sandarakinorhabdus fusca TaxID=1439888 RepID=A0A7C9GMC0_9SPHN|nr:DUF3011 domain-containing protein [Polymorphobacter fuscus]KAB7648377.1 DUF3011 domain-containing protein [Polymorphobacter fuscus]MQT15892.1 DUF3011 domain-containing protein [Polymorphobacter fuscus]NJC07835.1 hypothetical protein [Polymorphobacter fuscus]
MRRLPNCLAAMAMAIAQIAATAPALAQAAPTDRWARPQPGRPGPGNGNNNGGGWGGGNQGGSWNGGNWNGGNQGGNWDGASIRCESQNYRYRECRADTRGGVRLTRVRGGDCRQGHSWGYQRDVIWVNHGCRADFQTRNGGNNGNNGGGGPSTGAIIGGVAVAAGLAALLAAGNKKKTPPAQNGTAAPPLPQEPFVPPAGATGAPARITANTGDVTPSARPSLDTCLQEAARQIGATGGNEIRLDRLDDIQQGNGGYRFRFQLFAIYPDENRTIPVFCRATPTTLVELTFG